MGEADQAVTRRRQPADTEDEGLLPGSVTSDLCCPEGCWPKEVDRAEACVKVRSGERGVRGAPVVAVKGQQGRFAVPHLPDMGLLPGVGLPVVCCGGVDNHRCATVIGNDPLQGECVSGAIVGG